MRTKNALMCLLAAASLVGCPAPAQNHDSGTVVQPDTGGPGMDSGTPVDSGHVTPATDVPIASVVNASAADHPANMANIHVTGDLVALSSRLFISQSTTSMRCLFAIWVGTAAGGNNSAIEVTDDFAPTGSNTCFTEPAHTIPDTVMIGDMITNVTGQFNVYCPSGSVCPTFASQEVNVTTGTFTVGAHGSTPTATTATIAEITGMGATFGTRDAALQNALVTIAGTVIVTPPSAANHNVMIVAASGTTTPTMAVSISKYPGVTCQRTELSGMAAGATVGNITGVLQYSFGQWVLQPVQASALPGVPCTLDGGVGPG